MGHHSPHPSQIFGVFVLTNKNVLSRSLYLHFIHIPNALDHLFENFNIDESCHEDLRSQSMFNIVIKLRNHIVSYFKMLSFLLFRMLYPLHSTTKQIFQHSRLNNRSKQSLLSSESKNPCP